MASLNFLRLFRGCNGALCIKHSTRSRASEKRSSPGFQPSILLPIYWVTLQAFVFCFSPSVAIGTADSVPCQVQSAETLWRGRLQGRALSWPTVDHLITSSTRLPSATGDMELELESAVPSCLPKALFGPARLVPASADPKERSVRCPRQKTNGLDLSLPGSTPESQV